MSNVILKWAITWIWIIIPGLVGAALYWWTKELFIPMMMFFLLINKGLFDIYEAISDLKNQQEEDDKKWKSMFSKRNLF